MLTYRLTTYCAWLHEQPLEALMAAKQVEPQGRRQRLIAQEIAKRDSFLIRAIWRDHR